MQQLFINLPVQDLKKAMNFYSQLGFDPYPLFTFEDQKCLSWGEHILVMLHHKARPQSENNNPTELQKQLIPSFTLPVARLEIVHQIVEKGLQAGGKEVHPLLDEGFMQLRTIEDPDGYRWGIVCLDIPKFKAFKKKP